MSNESPGLTTPAPYEWIYAEIDGYQRCIGLIQGNRDIMIATGDGHSAWLDFAPTAKTMILSAVNGRNERSKQADSTPTPDLSTLDREALARLVGELQRKIAQIDKEYIHPDPSVPNPCTICGFHIYGSFTGDGDGSMKNGGRFAHPECYEKRRLEAERDEARAGMAWLVDFLLSLEQVNATPDREGWIAKARRYGAEMRTRIRELEQRVTLEAALADSNILTINILRLWDVEKTERFALHLLGDDWQGMAAENARLKAQVTTLESVIRAKDREIGQLVASIDDRERIITKQGETLAAARVEVERLTAADNPEYDATDGAHPAWWRGHDHTTKVFCALVNDILDGKDDGSGANREPWASTRKRLICLRAEKSKWQRRAKLFHEAYKDKDFELFAVGLQKMQLEAAGANVILPRQNKSLRARLFEAIIYLTNHLSGCDNTGEGGNL